MKTWIVVASVAAFTIVASTALNVLQLSQPAAFAYQQNQEMRNVMRHNQNLLRNCGGAT